MASRRICVPDPAGVAEERLGDGAGAGVRLVPVGAAATAFFGTTLATGAFLATTAGAALAGAAGFAAAPEPAAADDPRLERTLPIRARAPPPATTATKGAAAVGEISTEGAEIPPAA